LLAISTVGWVLRGVFGAAVAVAVYVIGAATLAKFKIHAPAEPDPDQVVDVDLRFRCGVCGAEVIMTAAQDGMDVEAPRHCREDMIPV
jgi:hypothetical protein